MQWESYVSAYLGGSPVPVVSEALEVYAQDLRQSVYAGELNAVPQLVAALAEVPVATVKLVLPEEHVQTVLQASLRGGYEALQVAEYVTY